MVYLILCHEDNTCKIGFSAYPKARLKAIQTSVPKKLILYAVIQGEALKEKDLHEKFKDYRLKGEWFQAHPEILHHFDENGVQYDAKTNPVGRPPKETKSNRKTLYLPEGIIGTNTQLIQNIVFAHKYNEYITTLHNIILDGANPELVLSRFRTWAKTFK